MREDLEDRYADVILDEQHRANKAQTTQAMSKESQITLGSIVRLRSGGPKMTVTWINPCASVPPEATCRWFLEGQTESNAITLPIAALELCTEP